MSDPAEPIQCPVCAGVVEARDAHVCPRCETPHHQDCWTYVDGCAIFGCRPPSPDAAAGALVPLDEDDRRTVAEWARWYTRVVRYHWWALLVMGLALAWVPVVAGMVGLPIGNVLRTLVAMVAGCLTLAGFAATAAYFLLLPPMIMLQGQLEARLGGPVRAPSQGARELLESMDISSRDGCLLQLVHHGWVLYLAVTVAATLGGGVAGMVYFCAWALFAMPIFKALDGFTGTRVVAIEALQNRLAASLKKR